MADHSLMKLGKKPRRDDARTLRLARYLTPALPAPPASVTNSHGVSEWGMMLNDKIGDCTIAGVAHAIQVWTLAKGNEVTVPDSTVLQYYEQWDGYDPNNPATDQGGVELDVLNDWRKQGFSGHELKAYADTNPHNTPHVKQAVYLFGGMYVGLLLPISAKTQEMWDVDNSPNGQAGSWGGHCVFVPDYDANSLTCITWGQLKKMTWNFWMTYCDEAHALLSMDWQPPAGFDIAMLEMDLEEVTG